jgi:glycosyltransferase involved in cell wall biosynthesis
MSIYGFCEYLPAQLESIVRQTILIDELVVVEDFSELDSPYEYLVTICEEHGIRLKYIKLKTNVGPAEGFRQAICASSGDIIYLCDHDDIWAIRRIENSLPFHDNFSMVIVNGKYFVSDPNQSSGSIYNSLNLSFSRSLVKNSIVGATLSIEGNFARRLARSTSFYPMHDWVISSFLLLTSRSFFFVNDCLVYYRRHGNTFTGNFKSSLITKFKYRIFLWKALLIAYFSFSSKHQDIGK